MLTVTAAAAAALVVLFSATWALSLAVHNTSIIDVIWGPSFAVVAWTAWAIGPGETPAVVLAVAATIWGGRLGLHLLVRAWGQPEDRRYREIRERHDATGFALRSLLTIFGTQALLALAISLPLLAVAAHRGSVEIGPLVVAAALCWVVGLTIEATADEQLRRFKAAPDSETRVLDTGLWAWSRHPNYFGDLVVWIGFGLAGLAVGAWWSVVGTAVMGALLVAGTGKPTLERTIADRRPGYRDYIESTSGFIPLPPKRSRS